LTIAATQTLTTMCGMQVLSRLGEAILQRHGIAYTYEQFVDRIHCQTEELLATVEDPEEAYQLVKVRAGR
jgi:hypothetical protein